MKFKNQIFIYVLLSICIFITTISWDKIYIPYNELNIIGEYSEKKFHSLNDLLRYLIFISIPITIFFSQVFFDKNKKENLLKNIYDKSYFLFPPYRLTLFFAVFIFLIILFEFLSLEFQIHNLDLLHEGQQLSSAYKYYLDGSLWSGSYVTIGIFYETILNKIVWNLFDVQSIGLKRFTDISLIFIFKTLLIIFCFQISNFFRLNSTFKSIFFIFNSFVFLSTIDYNILSVDNLDAREIPVLLILMLLIHTFQSKSFNNTILLIIGFLSITSLFWGVDRGLVINFIILCFLFFLIIRKNYKDAGILVLSVIFWWLLFYLLLGEEFKFFISNTLSIYKYISYVHGIIHPIPFSDDPNSSRATKTLLLIILSSLLTINLFFNLNKKFNVSFKFFMIFLTLVIIFSYIYVLGRSDGPHIKHIFGYVIIYFSIYFSYLFLEFLEKKEVINKYKIINLIPILLLILFSFYNLDFKFDNIKKYNSRFSNYINLPDANFLNTKEINFINETKPIFEKSDCVQLFSHDSAILYLLKKKSCSRFYLIWSVGSPKDQKDLVKELSKTEYIIAGGKKFNWLKPLNQRLPIANDYINKNYQQFAEVENWKILKRIN